MKGNGIKADGAKTMSEALKTNAILTSLDLWSEKENKRRKNEKKRERMTDNEIGDEGAKAMSEMLKMNTTLKTLNLGSEEENTN